MSKEEDIDFVVVDDDFSDLADEVSREMESGTPIETADTPSLEEAAGEVKRLHERLREAGRAEADLEVTYGASVESADDVKRWQDAGVDRLVVAPWSRSPDAVEALHRFAEAFL